MRFFRRRPSLGLVALLALATQGYLSFGHTHVHAHRASDAVATPVVASGDCSPAARPSCPQPASNDDDAACAICWTMGLVASLVLPESPRVSFQPPPNLAPGPVRVALRPADNKTVQFHARAPPLALSV
jgi:hypothetical protein